MKAEARPTRAEQRQRLLGWLDLASVQVLDGDPAAYDRFHQDVWHAIGRALVMYLYEPKGAGRAAGHSSTRPEASPQRPLPNGWRVIVSAEGGEHQ